MRPDRNTTTMTMTRANDEAGGEECDLIAGGGSAAGADAGAR